MAEDVYKRQPYRSKDIKETVIKGKDLARTERSTFLYTSNEQRQSPKGKKGEQQK